MMNTIPHVHPARSWPRGARRLGARGILCGLLLLAGGTAFGVRAQERPPGARRPTPTPTPQATPTPTSAPLRRVGGDVAERVGQGGQAFLTAGIYGAIRWKKEYGLPSTDGGQTPNKSLNCTAFRVDVTVQEGAPGTFGKATSVGYWTVQNEPTEENGYYVCRYSVTDRNPLPRDRVITVSAYLGPFASAELNRALSTGAWFASSASPPPTGQQRVLVGSRGITLTDSKPRATVDFEMVYRPLPSLPR
ncbi:MAG: hypothetical protein ACJ741_10130 [Pyrinomonadaceae bacterium]